MADAATAAKERGNAAYKMKDFATAHSHYDEAIRLDPTNIVFRNNKAAVYFEEKNYDKCLEMCTEAVEIGRENRADFKIIAKSFLRAGNAYEKKGDLHQAVVMFKKSLAEFRDTALVKRLNDLEKKIKEQERLAYINPEIALEEKTKGNEAFQKGDFPTAIKHYTESLKRNPDDPKVFSNRAASFIKRMEFHMALKDCEECIRLDPSFVKGYLRKAGAHLALKETSKAKDDYIAALELDPNCQEARDGLQKCHASGPTSDAEAKQQAMNDPEVQAILQDPAMRLILQQMQENPNSLQEHLKNEEIKNKLAKLIDCGILQVR